jgi:hypothetical protein
VGFVAHKLFLEVFVESLVEYRNFLEVVYFISGPLMLVGVVAACFQLRVLRKDLEVKYKREAIRETLLVFDNKVPRIEELKETLWLAEHDDELGDYISNGCVSFEFSSLDRSQGWVEDFAAASRSVHCSIDLLNEIDGLALSILSGLSDEDYAYRSEGLYFLTLASTFSHYVAWHRSDEPYYEAVVELYNRWSARKAASEIADRHRRELEELNGRPSYAPVKIIG